MSPRLAKSVRTVLLAGHILTTMAWFTFGSILVTADFTTQQTLSSYVAVLTIGPVAAVALGTGIVLAAGSPWGLWRYWWIVSKITGSAALCAFGALGLAGWLRPSALFAGRCAALVVLFALLLVSVAKPRGRIRYGDTPPCPPRHRGSPGRAVE